ncbi:hypothetical protein VFPPC_04916 [Pochonia chlamydosporia 170]|uniref:Uncharacterized protein n=1 Tax=Pochonia chlamydosporia 170 TaxID=1380566 RepID=A0A179FSZ4_METCM|nr:hypothetical protein VFPPC_04916 [Pochonia chlamydosporia 170]OAQ68714.1 hypothetical protein VFPPC_04916 [Pochonia chlamydosporia 170]
MGLGLELGLKEELCGLDWTGLGRADQTGQTKRLGVGGRVRGPERTDRSQSSMRVGVSGRESVCVCECVCVQTALGTKYQTQLPRLVLVSTLLTPLSASFWSASILIIMTIIIIPRFSAPGLHMHLHPSGPFFCLRPCTTLVGLNARLARKMPAKTNCKATAINPYWSQRLEPAQNGDSTGDWACWCTALAGSSGAPAGQSSHHHWSGVRGGAVGIGLNAHLHTESGAPVQTRPDIQLDNAWQRIQQP